MFTGIGKTLHDYIIVEYLEDSIGSIAPLIKEVDGIKPR